MRCLASLLLACGLLSGCIVVPYWPEAETRQELVEVSASEEILLSVGARSRLEAFAADLKKAEPRIECLDALTFRDLAFPDGGWTLAEFIDRGWRNTAHLAVDRLVLLALPRATRAEPFGGMIFHLGFFGYYATEESFSQAVLLVDTADGALRDLVQARATGTERGGGLFYGLFVDPMTETSVARELAKSTAQQLAAIKPSGPLRVVVMVVESSNPDTYPFPQLE